MLGLVLLSGVAHADAANDLFKKGVQALKKSDFEKAERLFQTSNDLAPRAATLCNLALTYERWGGHDPQAADAYDGCAKLDDTGTFREHAIERSKAIREAMKPPAPEPIPVPVPVPVPAPEPAPASEPAPVPVPVPNDEDHVEHPTRWWRWSAIGAGAVSVAFLGGGLYYINKSNTATDELAAKYPDGNIPADTPDADKLSQAAHDSTTGKRLYIASAIAGAAAVTFLVIDLTRPTTVHVAALPGGGALVGASFKF